MGRHRFDLRSTRCCAVLVLEPSDIVPKSEAHLQRLGDRPIGITWSESSFISPRFRLDDALAVARDEVQKLASF